MNDIKIIAQFRHLVNEFKQNQERLIYALGDRSFDDPVFETIDNLVIEIKEKLAHYDTLRIDDLSLRNDLASIRENKGFVYFELLELIRKCDPATNADRLTFAPNWEEFYENRWDDIMHDEIFSQVNPHTLIMRKMELGTLLVGKTVPGHLKTHLTKIKNCYAWGFETEASIYCRTILEEGFREALKSKPEFRTPQRKEDLENWPLKWLLNHSKKNRYFYKEVIDRAYGIKDNVNKIVHPTSAKEPEVGKSNREIVKDTFYILEMLFR